MKDFCRLHGNGQLQFMFDARSGESILAERDSFESPMESAIYSRHIITVNIHSKIDSCKLALKILSFQVQSLLREIQDGYSVEMDPNFKGSIGTYSKDAEFGINKLSGVLNSRELERIYE